MAALPLLGAALAMGVGNLVGASVLDQERRVEKPTLNVTKSHQDNYLKDKDSLDIVIKKFIHQARTVSLKEALASLRDDSSLNSNDRYHVLMEAQTQYPLPTRVKTQLRNIASHLEGVDAGLKESSQGISVGQYTSSYQTQPEYFTKDLLKSINVRGTTLAKPKSAILMGIQAVKQATEVLSGKKDLPPLRDTYDYEEMDAEPAKRQKIVQEVKSMEDIKSSSTDAAPPDAGGAASSPNDPTNPIAVPNDSIYYVEGGSSILGELAPHYARSPDELDSLKFGRPIKNMTRAEFIAKEPELAAKYLQIDTTPKDPNINPSSPPSIPITDVGQPSIPPVTPLEEPLVNARMDIAPKLDPGRALRSAAWDIAVAGGSVLGAAAIYQVAGLQGAMLFAGAVANAGQLYNNIDPTRGYSEQVGSQAVYEIEQKIMNVYQVKNPTSLAPQILNPLLTQTEGARTSIVVQDALANRLRSHDGINQNQQDFLNWYKDMSSPFAVR